MLAGISEEAARGLLFDWAFWGRPEQQEPAGDWLVWLLLAGRGFGKTRTGAEWVRSRVESGAARRIALVAETSADARDVLVEGESGLLAMAPPWNRPQYEPSKRRLTWPSGATASTFSGDEPDQLRGPQFDTAWVDELCKYKYPTECWDNLEFGLRLGSRPRVCVTTTPRPIAIIRTLLSDDDAVVTRGSSYDNVANLAPSYIARTIRKYEGTRIGRQELYAELLDDVPGAMWTRVQLDELRERAVPEGALPFRRVVVAIDPAVTATKSSDETGIGVAALGRDRHAYVLEDLSGRYSPDGWARAAVEAYRRHGADRVLGEVNNGGDLIESTLRTVSKSVPYRAVHATRGKHVRAEPIAALYEQKRVHHVGAFAALEDQMCAFAADGYQGAGSPDRVDWLVWALSDLMLTDREPRTLSGYPTIQR